MKEFIELFGISGERKYLEQYLKSTQKSERSMFEEAERFNSTSKGISRFLANLLVINPKLSKG